MTNNKVKISGIDTSKLKTIKYSEMKKLFIISKEGDLFARDLLVEYNLKLVLSILKKFYYKNENLDDLFQVGCIGLLKAIDNFDLKYNVQFSTYAVPMILGEIKRYLRDNNTLRVSRSVKDLSYKIIKYMDDFYQENGFDADYDIVAEKLGVSNYDIGNALLAMKEPVSMYEPIFNDGGETIYLYDQIIDDSSDNNFSDKLEFNNALDNLDDRERFILDQRYLIGKTQVEIANSLDISQAQVSRLEKKAIKELKKVLK